MRHSPPHRQNGVVNMTWTMGGKNDTRYGGFANMRSLENDDAKTNDYCDGYQKLMCYAWTNSDHDAVRIFTKVWWHERAPPSPIHSCHPCPYTTPIIPELRH